MCVFPTHWDRRKVDEVRLVIYLALVASLFWLHPEAVADPVYDPWRKIMPVRHWAAVMMAVCVVHVVAIRINGLWPLWSTMVRMIALGLHCGVALTFSALFFAAGAYWGSLTYSFLVAGPLLGSILYTCEKAAKLWKSSPS